MDCPLCNTEIGTSSLIYDFPSIYLKLSILIWLEHESLKSVLDPMKALKELIKERALKRLQYLKEEKAKEIVEKGMFLILFFFLII